MAHEINNTVQSEKQLILSSTETQNLQDTGRLTWTNFYAGGTKEGVSKDLLNEYHNITERNKIQGGSRFDYRKNMPETDLKRLEEIFLKMSLTQQEQEKIIFWKPSPPLKRVVPTQKQFNSFKNPKVYGLWVNEKKVPNTALNSYSAKDFSQMFISKLYGPAKKGRGYSYQVDLMTNDYYEAYRTRTLADKTNKMGFQSPRPGKN